jgi:hypothetical protein
MESLAELEAEMAAAVAREDYEAAARLRDRIKALSAATDFKRQTPGKMGLGTNQQVNRPPEGWKPPPKPDPMTSGHKKGGRRST